MNTRRLVVTLAFLGCLFYAGDRALSQNWAATSSPSKGWNSIASSADGTQVVAAEGSPGLIYVSKDAGANWTATTAPPDYWSCVASSADGAKLMAVSSSPSYYHGHLYTSTDSGAHWISNSPPAGFDLGVSVASSADGTKLAMVSFNSDSGTFTVISTSTNSGSTWTVPSQPYNLSSSWNWVASSADGTKLVAAEGYLGFGHIYRSIDSGRTWSATSAPTTNEYVAIACSADGSHLLAASNDGQVYTSTNSGTTWLAHNVPWNNSAIGSPHTITGVASSADGTRFFAVTSTGLMYTSTNAGVAWTSNNVAVVPWTAVTCSTNGTKAFAATCPVRSMPRLTPATGSFQAHPAPIGPPWLPPPMGPISSRPLRTPAPFGLTHLRRCIRAAPFTPRPTRGPLGARPAPSAIGSASPPPPMAPDWLPPAISTTLTRRRPATARFSPRPMRAVPGPRPAHRTVPGPRWLPPPTARTWWRVAAGPFTPRPMREGPGLRIVCQAAILGRRWPPQRMAPNSWPPPVILIVLSAYDLRWLHLPFRQQRRDLDEDQRDRRPTSWCHRWCHRLFGRWFASGGGHLQRAA